MEPTVSQPNATPTPTPPPKPELPTMTPQQAEAYATVLQAIKPFFESHQAHVERVNEQNRIAARPMFIIAGLAVAAVAVTGVSAFLWLQDAQLARDLLLPLLTFAGGLGIGRVAATTK